MATGTILDLVEVERRVCDIVSEQLAIPRAQVRPTSQLLQDFGIDSLDVVELVMALEEAFGVTLPDASEDPFTKTVFTWSDFCLRDFAEVIYLQCGNGRNDRPGWRGRRPTLSVGLTTPFMQLSGVWTPDTSGRWKLFERLEVGGPATQHRRRSDGMRCLTLPAATVEIGSEGLGALGDEGPRHLVKLDAFRIDAEPVSTTAYCRFLNSVGEVSLATLAVWFALDPRDGRNAQAVVAHTDGGWRPVPGTERCPMVLVSWHGANAYSLWANGHDWRGGGSCLPTEAQWEYAARGATYRTFPWGDEPADGGRMRYGRHQRGDVYRADTMPMAAVNDTLGMSPFGLHHMAGNVWQWCRDWYDRDFYRTPEATTANAVNGVETGVRSERGGSWVGPAELCRSSYRRGRPPAARGRCLGFRCVSDSRA